jgi:hypothetical protein
MWYKKWGEIWENKWKYKKSVWMTKSAKTIYLLWQDGEKSHIRFCPLGCSWLVYIASKTLIIEGAGSICTLLVATTRPCFHCHSLYFLWVEREREAHSLKFSTSIFHRKWLIKITSLWCNWYQ